MTVDFHDDALLGFRDIAAMCEGTCGKGPDYEPSTIWMFGTRAKVAKNEVVLTAALGRIAAGGTS